MVRKGSAVRIREGARRRSSAWLERSAHNREVGGSSPPAATDGNEELMASVKRPPITLACEQCKERNYVTNKNRTNTRDRLKLKKYCSRCRQHTPHKETR